MAVEKGTLEYRVLVELSGQARPMSVQELHEAIGDVAPEDLHTALYDLAYYTETVYPKVPGSPYRRDYDSPQYKITWEGDDALRRADVEDTRRMRRVPEMTWWERIKRVWRT